VRNSDCNTDCNNERDGRLRCVRPKAESVRQGLPALAKARHAILVTMTRKEVTQSQPAAQPLRSRWPLQDAKARFSELVRRAHSDGPQRVTLHGRDAVVVVDADEFDRMQGARTGEMLIDALQSSPYRDIEIEPARRAMPVRAVKL
jgi:prevent-host-death family protein